MVQAVMTIAAEEEMPVVRRRSSLIRSPQFSSLVILIALLAVFAIADANFLSPLNISNMMAFLPELGIIAL
ncbi:MAG: ABC transporter permease, partial [Mesorhizobium sp.]